MERSYVQVRIFERQETYLARKGVANWSLGGTVSYSERGLEWYRSYLNHRQQFCSHFCVLRYVSANVAGDMRWRYASTHIFNLTNPIPQDH